MYEKIKMDASCLQIDRCVVISRMRIDAILEIDRGKIIYRVVTKNVEFPIVWQAVKINKRTLPIHTFSSSLVDTVAILAQGNNWILRSRNPFYVFSKRFDSDGRTFFIFSINVCHSIYV